MGVEEDSTRSGQEDSAQSASRNRQRLIARFCDRLLTLEPRSVLDVGCGDGSLMDRIASSGISVTGIEPAIAKLAALSARGLRTIAGSAQRLPFRDGAFECVALRHVAHHLPDPGAGIREAARVARHALLVAEPWRDLAHPEQETALDIDRFAKRQDRRHGRVHLEDHTGDEMVALLPEPGAWTTGIETFQEYKFAALEGLRGELEQSISDLPAHAPEHAELEGLLREAERTGVGLTGTVIVTAVRRSP